MKLKNSYTLVDISGKYIAVNMEKKEDSFNGIIQLNETGKLIWDGIEKGLDVPAIVAELMNEYEVDETTARKGVERVVKQLLDAGVAEA